MDYVLNSDDTVVECTSTKFGTFGVIVEIYEPPSVEDDQTWLLITKMIGYGFSIILLAIFAFSVLISKHMWEMFHILAMNFAFALLLRVFALCLFCFALSVLSVLSVFYNNPIAYKIE